MWQAYNQVNVSEIIIAHIFIETVGISIEAVGI